MVYSFRYKTPRGFSDMMMNSDGESLTGLWFVGSRDTKKHNLMATEKPLPVFEETVRWLDTYYSGKCPDFTPPYRLEGLTPFRRSVMELLLQIPFGALRTYGELAEILAGQRGIEKMSSQAVGGAVGWNPICLIVPCHRVVGAKHSLTGYGGGIQNKAKLLELEGHNMSLFTMPCTQDGLAEQVIHH